MITTRNLLPRVWASRALFGIWKLRQYRRFDGSGARRHCSALAEVSRETTLNTALARPKGQATLWTAITRRWISTAPKAGLRPTGASKTASRVLEFAWDILLAGVTVSSFGV